MSGAAAPALPPRRRLWSAGAWITVALVAAFVWAALGLDLSAERLARMPHEVGRILTWFFPPDLTYGRTSALPAIVESIQIAWLGTLIGALLSLPLAFLAARNLSPLLSRPVKVLMSAVRAVPEILLAVFFVPIVGLGAFAGTLAIGLHSVGMLGKLGSDVIESMDTGPVEAVRASGGSGLAALRYAVLPQVLPEILAQWLFRFEINIRASTVLGVVGAGGVGGVLLNNLRYRHFDKAGAVLLLTVLVVLAIDTLSGVIRKRLVRDA